jgi:flavin reductase (DIM6/NTAB) family NADH-FMN oxidoreductase RutF
MIFETGRFVLHLLGTDQFDLIHELGFASGRTRDKLAHIPHHAGRLGAPVLDQCYAYLECEVINVMDTGSSTCFLGQVSEVGYGRGNRPTSALMTATYFRANMPAEWRPEYEAQLEAAQRFAEARSGDIKAVIWRGLRG